MPKHKDNDGPISLQSGGVDPSILRELSGIYKPFFQAFKELVSNAYDANANSVRIRLAADYESIDIVDDGIGMTLFEFRADFTRLGGSLHKIQRGPIRKGRLRIGSKGIGFLAVARYCSAMEIVSTTLRTHRGKIDIQGKTGTLDFSRLFEVPIPPRLLHNRFRITSLTVVRGKTRRRLRPSEFELLPNGRVRITNRKRPATSCKVELRYALDCSTLEFKAIIDYDYLLSLENKMDLSQLSDFCTLSVNGFENDDERVKQEYTRISLKGLKQFVVRDLKAPRKPGRVRNIESESGLDQFVWNLSRCIPIKYDPRNLIKLEAGGSNLESPQIQAIDSVIFRGPDQQDLQLLRPLWSGNKHDKDWNTADDIILPIDINQSGLRATGYILGHREALFPAEFRGIAVRVRNVQIGAPSFFGSEQALTGLSRSLLSQITGEVNVFEGLDAIDALNPGRDSFYEENGHYKILRRQIVGDGETVSGILGAVINQMLEKMQILSTVESLLLKANNYRAALVNLSMAINHYGTNATDGASLREFFSSTQRVNGLSHREDYDSLPGPRLLGYRVMAQHQMEGDHLIDFARKSVYLNLAHERWNKRIFVLGQHYEVVAKMGSSNDPLSEIDTTERKVYVNWSHPLRQQMGDVAFLKSAVVWKLSYHACGGDIESMMDLALNLLTFDGV